MNLLRKAVLTALAGSALTMASGQAGADDITYSGSDVTTAVAPGASSWSFNTLPTTSLFGWSHTSIWKTLDVTTSGDVWVTLAQTAAGQRHGAFTLWSTGDGLTATRNTNGGQHRYSEVRGPNDAAVSPATGDPNVSTWMGTSQSVTEDPGVHNNVDHIVGYGNMGVSFTNTDGDPVGYGAVFDGTQSFNAANPHIAASGSSSTTVSAAHGDFAQGGGIEYTQLFLKGLQAGHYVFFIGGSAADSANYGVAGTQSLIISSVNPIVSAVPIPAAVWLLGSALTGMSIVGRRKQTA
jgi:hypothetical protein